MDGEQAYLFDLNGYIVIRNALSPVCTYYNPHTPDLREELAAGLAGDGSTSSTAE
jgi:hypothetical protein